MRTINRAFGGLFVALFVLGLAVSSSQAEVYTSNAVGYVKLQIPAGGGWVQLATPFDAANSAPMTLDQVFGDTFPDWTTVQFHSPNGYQIFTYLMGEWRNTSMLPSGDYQVLRGTGCWVCTPVGTDAMELVIAGEVPEPPLNEVMLAPGHNIFSFGFPTETPVNDALLNARDWDTIQLYTPGGGYTTWTYIMGAWRDASMAPASFSFMPGYAYWYYNASPTALAWDQPKLYE